VLTAVSRLSLRRDKVTGRMKQILDVFSFAKERLVISSGRRTLSAVYVSAGDDAPVVLICHGIGEWVEYWGGVQSLLQRLGISSLVFNYSGYGTSSGTISTAHCEEDAAAAYQQLIGKGHRSIVLLGFSLGTGVVCAVAPRVDVAGVVLCEGFSTLREAGIAMGFPHCLARAVPDAWNTVHRVAELGLPVLVVHSEDDRLFPLSMARRVFEACGSRGELVVMRGFSHDAPIYSPTKEYWEPIAAWVKQRAFAGKI
jgi:alpha-beta hydrolase superfamily lysophospholipase